MYLTSCSSPSSLVHITCWSCLYAQTSLFLKAIQSFFWTVSHHPPLDLLGVQTKITPWKWPGLKVSKIFSEKVFCLYFLLQKKISILDSLDNVENVKRQFFLDTQCVVYLLQKKNPQPSSNEPDSCLTFISSPVFLRFPRSCLRSHGPRLKEI